MMVGKEEERENQLVCLFQRSLKKFSSHVHINEPGGLSGITPCRLVTSLYMINIQAGTSEFKLLICAAFRIWLNKFERS